ncbi:acetate/propionate family kinase [Roseomonas stagni]|uniref:Acetate kinase n=1 Tax=Falsiroseomonas algicola TaxID=2716930 RepID=A0A6M1LJK8_9PROT|nr:acetate/propionate family kinase [Falsiroseomonas algicola]NGM20312.1 acetate/propionate family kinase [Falsiroseomonas algicola]
MTSTPPLIGVINAGSSSVKAGVFAGERRVLSCVVEGIGAHPATRAKDADGTALPPPALDPAPRNPGEAASLLLPWLRAQLGGQALSAIGHRVVHGGAHHAKPERITPALLAELEALVPLAPLHEPHNLAPIRAIAVMEPTLPQVACFDTAFHRSMPAVNQAFAIPAALAEAGIRRYGFHGLSYEYIASALPAPLPQGRVVVAHLGNGASACAMRAGVSVATTMGFTALDGLPMGTRSGAIDPGVVLHLMQARGMSADEVQDLLYKRSGLLGLSGGLSSDMRTLLASDDPRAGFAVEVFCLAVSRAIASLAVTLGGLDGIVFTAGIGEHAAPVRAAVLRHLAWLGVTLDEVANATHGPRISTADSRIAALVLPTDEERMIARHTASLALS